MLECIAGRRRQYTSRSGHLGIQIRHEDEPGTKSPEPQCDQGGKPAASRFICGWWSDARSFLPSLEVDWKILHHRTRKYRWPRSENLGMPRGRRRPDMSRLLHTTRTVCEDEGSSGVVRPHSCS